MSLGVCQKWIVGGAHKFRTDKAEVTARTTRRNGMVSRANPCKSHKLSLNIGQPLARSRFQRRLRPPCSFPDQRIWIGETAGKIIE